MSISQTKVREFFFPPWRSTSQQGYKGRMKNWTERQSRGSLSKWSIFSPSSSPSLTLHNDCTMPVCVRGFVDWAVTVKGAARIYFTIKVWIPIGRRTARVAFYFALHFSLSGYSRGWNPTLTLFFLTHWNIFGVCRVVGEHNSVV